jgi:hypothetical protein
MERIPPRSLSLIPACLLLLSGCVHFDLQSWSSDEPAPHEVCQVVSTWTPEVLFLPDPTKGGAPGPGLTGRVYLFGPEVKTPLTGKGTLTVDLYDDAPLAEGKAPVLLEEWRFDRATLKRLCRKDAIGRGYTLFLPWGTYRPELTHIHLQIRYDPPEGPPVLGQSSPLVLNRGLSAATQVSHRQVRPKGP